MQWLKRNVGFIGFLFTASVVALALNYLGILEGYHPLLIPGLKVVAVVSLLALVIGAVQR